MRNIRRIINNLKYKIQILLILFVLSAYLLPAFSVYAGELSNEATEEDASETVSEGEETDYSELWPAGPDINGDAAIVVDASTGLILYAKDIYSQYYPASITKIMTTLVALENSSLNETVTVSYEAEWYVSKTSSRMGLVEGEQLSMEEALYGIMLESANEATYAVGEHVADGSIAKFIKMMNNKAAELGCTNTRYANTHGLHDDEHYTSCYDMALISMAAMKNATFRKITGTSTYEMPATNKNPERLLTNHHKFINKEISYDYCIGGKTGATTEANYNLVTMAKKDGMTVISIVMHSDSWSTVYADSKLLLDFTFDNYSLSGIEETRLDGIETFPSMFTEIPQFKQNEESILRISEDGNIVLPNYIDRSEAVGSMTLTTPEELGHGDNVIGNISYTFGGKTVANADVLFFNSENPITMEVFNDEWPDFMIPIDVAFPESSEAATASGGAASGITASGSAVSGKTASGTAITDKTMPGNQAGNNPSGGILITGSSIVDTVSDEQGNVVIRDDDTKNLPKEDSSEENTESTGNDYRPVILAVISFVVVLMIGFIIIFKRPKRDY